MITLVGGGPVGSALACALAHQGIPVRVVDRVPLPALLSDRTSDNRAIALSPTAKNLLKTIGIWQNLQKDAEPILEIKTVHGSTGSTVSFQKDHTPLGYIVPMSVLKQGIAQRVKDFSPLIQWVTGEVADIQKNTYSLSVLLKEGTVLETPVVIGADGKNSKVRKLGGFEVMAWDYGKEAIVCTYKQGDDHHGIAWEIFMEEGPFAILPMTQNRFSIVWSVQEDIAHALKELSDEEFDAVIRGKIEMYMASLVTPALSVVTPALEQGSRAPNEILQPVTAVGPQCCTGGPGSLLEGRDDSRGVEMPYPTPPSVSTNPTRANIERISPRWIYPIGIQLTERYAKDGIVLVGDAAHVMHPLAGQGVNMGFRDVAALTEILVEYHALGLSLGDPQAHEKYERQRRFDNLSMTLMTDGFDALFSNHSKILEKLRERGVQWVERSRGLKSLFVENAVGVL